MAQSEFSETQFVVGYLKELWVTRLSTLPFAYYFSMPSTVIEKDFPVDFYIDYYSHSEYYQFKRSEKISDNRGRELKRGLSASYLPYFRFKIYNNISKGIGTGQFEKLKEMAARFPNDFVGYCAPCFIDDWDYMNFYHRNEIIRNSVLIDCNQFNDPRFGWFDINDGDDHYMVYNTTNAHGFLFSEPNEIQLTFPSTLRNTIKERSSFATYVDRALELGFNSEFESSSRTTDFKLPNNRDTIWRKAFLFYEFLFTNYGIIWNPIFHSRTNE